MRRATSTRSTSRILKVWQYKPGLALAALGVFLLAIWAVVNISHGPMIPPDPYADAQDNRAERTLIQTGVNTVNAGVELKSRSALLDENANAQQLAEMLVKTRTSQVESSNAKLQSTDQVERLDRDAARHQLRTKAKAVSKLSAATEYPLVVYNLLDSDDPENEANLKFYVREGIRETDECMHIIIVNPKQDLRTLPALQVENARYLKAKLKGCVWGAFGSFLLSSTVDLTKFTSFIFLSSVVRGPFLPAHARNMGVSWQQMLTSKLDNATKLVGPVISCQDIVWPDSVADSDRQHGQPHFSPNVFATDKVGLDLLMRKHDVFQCHSDGTPNPDHFSAVMASTAILEQGYNLDCLMQRYQGVRWQEKETRSCNAGLRATEGDYYYDGVSVHPMEVMFVEVTGMMLRKNLFMAKTAKQYDKWRQSQLDHKEDVTTNMYAFDPKIYRAAKIAYMEKRGLGCFDFKFYSAHNPDVAAAAGSLSDFWNHFVYSGQFENRQYRFNCLDILARSHNCFDSDFYNRANEDLNQLRLQGRPLSPQEAWNHFLETGFFESRKYRFMDVCDEDLDSPNNLGEGS